MRGFLPVNTTRLRIRDFFNVDTRFQCFFVLLRSDGASLAGWAFYDGLLNRLFEHFFAFAFFGFLDDRRFGGF